MQFGVSKPARFVAVTKPLLFSRRLKENRFEVCVEIDDHGMAEILGEVLEVCATRKEAVDLMLGELSDLHGHGGYLRRMTRQGQEMPLIRSTTIQKSDVMHRLG